MLLRQDIAKGKANYQLLSACNMLPLLCDSLGKKKKTIWTFPEAPEGQIRNREARCFSCIWLQRSWKTHPKYSHAPHTGMESRGSSASIQVLEADSALSISSLNSGNWPKVTTSKHPHPPQTKLRFHFLIYKGPSVFSGVLDTGWSIDFFPLNIQGQRNLGYICFLKWRHSSWLWGLSIEKWS